MIEEVLPAEASSHEAFTDPPDALLFPEEQMLVARAVEKRRREFATGRSCARSALSGLGVSPAPIRTGERGVPLWPPGIVGSITHCAGYRAAAVAWDHDLASIGLDAEPNDVLPHGVLDLITLAGERARIRGLAGAHPGICWDRLLFSAKESVYKAWFPLAQCWLGFEDVDITFDASGTFDARLLVTAPPVRGSVLTGFSGRWLVRDGLILTTVTVPTGGHIVSGSGRAPSPTAGPRGAARSGPSTAPQSAPPPAFRPGGSRVDLGQGGGRVLEPDAPAGSPTRESVPAPQPRIAAGIYV